VLVDVQAAHFWRRNCLTLVRKAGFAHSCTNNKLFYTRGHNGSTQTGHDALFILLGGIMVLAMHAGFAFLELGTVRKKNQVNALVKILVDFSVSTVVYFMVGYSVAYGTSFFVGAEQLAAARTATTLVKFFFSADLCGGHSGHCFGRHCRTCPLLAPTDCNGGDRGLCLPTF
jgi:hypothetical protein